MQAKRGLAVAAVALVSGALSAIATPADAQLVGIGSTKSSVVAQMAAAIAKVVSANAGLQMRTQTMGGTQQYVPLVNAGQLEFGIGNMYQTAQAYAGIGLSAGHKYDNLRMVATLMPFRNGVLVANKSSMKTMADLKGKRIPYGFNAAPLFQNFFEGFLANGGLTFADVDHVPAIGLRPSWELFMQGKVDAVIAAVGGGPNKEMNAKIDGGIRYLDEVTTGPNAKKTLELLTNTYFTEVSPAPQYPGDKVEGQRHRLRFCLVGRQERFGRIGDEGRQGSPRQRRRTQGVEPCLGAVERKANGEEARRHAVSSGGDRLLQEGWPLERNRPLDRWGSLTACADQPGAGAGFWPPSQRGRRIRKKSYFSTIGYPNA